jgi:hypothetical protein
MDIMDGISSDVEGGVDGDAAPHPLSNPPPSSPILKIY